MRLGVLGGTFDPVHYGHLIIAQEALEALGLATVIFVPAASPPHKRDRAPVPIEHRYRMTELALEDDPRFCISDIECRRGGTSYTVNTLEEMQRSLGPGDELCFLIGSDTVSELPTWKGFQRLPELCRLIIVARPGFPLEDISSLAPHFPQDTVARLRRQALAIRPIGISATVIRRKLSQGRSIRYLVPEPVRDYIEQHDLYGRPQESPPSPAPRS